MKRIILVLALLAIPSVGWGQVCTIGTGNWVITPTTVTFHVCNSDGTAWLDLSNIPVGGAVWGTITGILSSQTDLQTALNGKLANNGDGSLLTGLTKTQVGLSNVDNTSDASKPVSTATQTALNTKQATLVSATNIKTVNGSTLLGSGDLVVSGTSVYTLNVQALTSSPVDAQTIYLGQLPKAPVTTQGQSRIYIRRAGTIRQVNLFSFSGTAGTNESWTCNVRLNNTGDTSIAAVASATSERVWFNANLNLAVTTSDYIEVKCVNPTWVTNPLTTIFGGYLIVEG